MSGPIAATSYEESIGSCGPLTPHTPPAPSAPRSAPVRRQLDFTDGGDLENDEDDDFLCRVADEIERGYSEAKLRAPPCVCGRGVCAVQRDDKNGRWKYVCPSWPKCKHVAFWEEADLHPKPLPASRSHPKPSSHCAFNDPIPSNPCAFNSPSNHMTGPRTPVNVCPQVAGATKLFSDSPQGTVAATLVNISPHGEGAATLANDNPQGAGTTALAKFIPQGVVTTTPAKVSPQGAPVKVSPQGARSSCQRPVCQCTAGNCRKSRIGDEDYYVCPIPKGKGACSYKVLVRDFLKDTVPSAQATPCDEVHPESPSILHRPIPAVNTPSKSPMQPYGTPSPTPPNSNDKCYRCGKQGHWMKDCPK